MNSEKPFSFIDLFGLLGAGSMVFVPVQDKFMKTRVSNLFKPAKVVIL
jgi:hypothetical protein